MVSMPFQFMMVFSLMCLKFGIFLQALASSFDLDHPLEKCFHFELLTLVFLSFEYPSVS